MSQENYNQEPDGSCSVTAEDKEVKLSPPKVVADKRSLRSAFKPPPRKRMPEDRLLSNGAAAHQSSRRMRLLIFTKIILKCLDYEPSLHLEAKQIITDCTKKNREGFPGYDPLADVISRQLRIAVGEVHWNRAEGLMEHYIKTRQRDNNWKRRNEPKLFRYAAV